jgi:hypothetical protein
MVKAAGSPETLVITIRAKLGSKGRNHKDRKLAALLQSSKRDPSSLAVNRERLWKKANTS